MEEKEEEDKSREEWFFLFGPEIQASLRILRTAPAPLISIPIGNNKESRERGKKKKTLRCDFEEKINSTW